MFLENFVPGKLEERKSEHVNMISNASSFINDAHEWLTDSY